MGDFFAMVVCGEDLKRRRGAFAQEILVGEQDVAAVEDGLAEVFGLQAEGAGAPAVLHGWLEPPHVVFLVETPRLLFLAFCFCHAFNGSKFMVANPIKKVAKTCTLLGKPLGEGRGATGSRTPDLFNAIEALYQLSYDPDGTAGIGRNWGV